jgi:hypothetical protein
MHTYTRFDYVVSFIIDVMGRMGFNQTYVNIGESSYGSTIYIQVQSHGSGKLLNLLDGVFDSNSNGVSYTFQTFGEDDYSIGSLLLQFDIDVPSDKSHEYIEVLTAIANKLQPLRDEVELKKFDDYVEEWLDSDS